MKKVLLGTSALVAASVLASSGAVAAEKLKIGLGGYMEQSIAITSLDNGATCATAGTCLPTDGVWHFDEQEVFFKGSTTLDNGIKVAVDIQLEGNTSGDQIDEAYLTLTSPSMGQLLMGSENAPNYKMSVSYPTVSRSGLSSGDYTTFLGNPTGSDVVDTPFASTLGRFDMNDSAHFAYYSPRFAGFQIGLAYVPAGEQLGAKTGAGLGGETEPSDGFSGAINFKNDFDGIGIHAALGVMHWSTVATAANNAGTNDDSATLWNTGVNVSFSGFTVGGSYSATNSTKPSSTTEDASGYSWNIGASYSTGPFGVSAGYMYGETADTRATAGDSERTGWEFAGLYNLGPGINWHASIAYIEIDGETSGATAGVDDTDGVVGYTGIVVSF